MSTYYLLTLTGPDRIGIVEELTKVLLERGGNVETSRMARLGGEFAVLLLVALPSSQGDLDARSLKAFTDEGYGVAVKRVEQGNKESQAGWQPYQIEVSGGDNEGIIHEVARYLSQRGINIESVESECVPASTSGVPLFMMTAQVLVPPSLGDLGWEAGLEEICSKLNLDVEVTRLPLR